MSNPYVGEIRLFAGNFAPQDWMFCQGQLLSISDNSTLFNLIGTIYGGDGVNTFALPNLQSRLAIHQGSDGLGNSYTVGATGGVETVTLTTGQLPVHTHPPAANGNANSGSAASGSGAILGSPNTNAAAYGSGTSLTALSPKAVGPTTGGGLPHSNVKPYQCVNYIISLFGVYPSQN